ncbi:MAG: HAMP domain-containing sensor histidine kinase [Pseudomonadota bacterium]
MARSLTTRLVLTLVTLLITVGVAFVYLAKWSSDRYHQEITQRLNATIAGYIVEEEPLLGDSNVNSSALEHVAHMAMIINPVAEVYLLDDQGRILGHALPQSAVTTTHVDLAPIEAYLEGDSNMPVRGADPLNPGEKKVFSAAPIETAGKLVGYVYVVLGGQKYESEAEQVLDSHILRISVGSVVALVLISALVGLLAVRFLTRRLRRLVVDLRRFQAGGFREPVKASDVARNDGDEINTLRTAFHDLSATVADQIRQLETTDSTRRELIANVSHDLRTPIASMKGYLDTLLMKHESLAVDERQRYLEVATRHSAYLGKLVEDLFELSCLDSGLVQPAPEAFSLSELVQDVAQKYQLQAAQARITLAPHVDREAPLVKADIGMIQQVLENLIGNALRHTPARGEISVTVTPGADTVTTVVADTGQGIANEDLPHIFNRAYSGGESRQKPRANAGLGLAIVKRILDLHNADITVTSRIGEGSAFRFELPLVAAG